MCPVQMLFRCSTSTWVAKEGLNSRLSWGGDTTRHSLKSNIVNCSNYTTFVLLPRLRWSHLNRVCCRQGSRSSGASSIPFYGSWTLLPGGPKAIAPSTARSRTLRVCSETWGFRGRETWAADHVWALRRLAARGRSLGTGTAELTCCTELCLRSGYLFPQKHLPEGPDLAQTRISRVSFTIWNCKPLSAFIQHNYCCLMSTSCTVCP